MVRPSPARERAIASPAKSTTSKVKQPSAATIEAVSYCFASPCAPGNHGRICGPCRRKQNQRVTECGKMIPISEETDRLGWVGHRIKAPWALRSLRDLEETDEDAQRADGEDDKAQPTPLAVGQEQGAKENRQSGAIRESTLSQVWCGETLIGSQGGFCCKSAKSSAEDALLWQ